MGIAKPKLPTMGKLIATFATDPVSEAVSDAPKGAQLPLIADHAAQPIGPVQPVLRLNYDLPNALGPNDPAVIGTPFSALLPETKHAPTCPQCRGVKRLVPPSNFFYVCPTCYADTFPGA